MAEPLPATLQVALLHPDARLPETGHPGDAGYDLRTVESFRLAVGERRLVSTGVAIALPPGVAGLVVPRSGLAIRHGLSVVNGPGLIDPNFRGEIKLILVNLGNKRFEAVTGDRLAQLLLIPYWAPRMALVEMVPDGPDERGADGFGSTGL